VRIPAGASYLFVYFLGTVFVYSYIRVAFKQNFPVMLMMRIKFSNIKFPENWKGNLIWKK